MDKITVAVPCYNEEAALSPFFAVLTDVAEKMDAVDFEFLFINDGSRDKTLEKIKELAAADKRVKYISFSRNFGKEAGIYAGLKNASGDYVVIMDSDLQDPPALLPEMYRAVTEDSSALYVRLPLRSSSRTPSRSVVMPQPIFDPL